MPALWGPWDAGEPSRLRLWFEARGIRHADSMSDVVLRCFWRFLHGRPHDLDTLLAEIPCLREKDWSVELSEFWPSGESVDVLSIEHKVVGFVVDAGGRTTIKDQEISGDRLRELLFPYAETVRDELDPDKPSLIAVRLQCHRDAPFRAARGILRACADPSVRIRRVYFAVRDPGSGSPGALAVFPAWIWTGAPPLPPEGPDTAFVKTTAETTVGEVVARLLALRRTGIRRVVFRDGADPGSDFMVALGGE